MGGTYYKSGSWNVTCDVCSKKLKSTEIRRRWDGFLVCSDDWEERHPQDFVRGKLDKIVVDFSRPIPPLTFTNVPYIIYYVYPDYVVTDYIQDATI